MLDLRPATLITPVITSIAAVVSVVLSNRLSLTRSHSEKAWEIRRQVYGEILFELSHASTKCRWVEEGYQIHGSGYFQGPTPTLDEVYEHCAAATRAFRTNYIMLSDEFIAGYETFREARASNEFDPDPIEAFETLSKALRLHVPLLTERARSEVIVRPWRWLRRG